MKPGDIFSQSITCQYEPNEAKREDSSSFDFEDAHLHMLAVFDGCGGLGARRYSALDNKTGAYIAAQICARVTANWKAAITPELLQDTDALTESFSRQVIEALRYLEEKYADDNKLIGTMVRTMPCTAAMALVHTGEDRSVKLMTIHAGDSRVYLLTAEHGLQQLTRDDLRGDPDALKNLYVSAPLTNVINIDSPFSLHVQQWSLAAPFAVLAATDGIFGYVRTPMDFEDLLLRALCEAESMQQFEDRFRAAIAAVSGDDATAVMAFYGWDSFAGIRESLSARASHVAAICAALDRDPTDAAIEAAWLTYKQEACL